MSSFFWFSTGFAVAFCLTSMLWIFLIGVDDE